MFCKDLSTLKFGFVFSVSKKVFIFTVISAYFRDHRNFLKKHNLVRGKKNYEIKR